MKNTIKFSLSIVACSILVACSSGGSSHNDSAPTGANTPSINSGTTNSGTTNSGTTNSGTTNSGTTNSGTTNSGTTNSGTTNSGTTNSGTTNSGTTNSGSTTQSTNAVGAAYVISGEDDRVTVLHKDITDASNLNVLVIDGQRLRVSYQDQGISAGSWFRQNDSANCCGRYSDVRFGVLDADNSDKDYIYYHGNPTKTMPMEGSASYQGYFVINADQEPRFDDDDLLYGTGKFSVNFGNKTLSGNLEGESSSGLAPLSMTAKISGNSFTGDLVSRDFATDAKVEGKFFGNNAKELGGIFKDDRNTWGGAFGASQ
ncbi:Slam-dependent surface lipoprotein [Otariodibacter oris]|uniref:Transferrin binding protein n=1 Tax=Otariodibacter oris TaxID=1032623 RepID=A0A420XI72_9PAST|nr:Slam-dependent surface lipoprotein [Otariodibacter oris]QGM80786.1 hypothetical protein A6A10_04895 [Otariodibacter oris]RKR77045.1 transferrin binding protein [Otariodibacter oris]